MSFHLDFEHKACIHSDLLCCVYSQYHLALTMHRCSLTQGPFMFHQDLQRSANCIHFLISLSPYPRLLLFLLILCPWLLSCCTPWSVLCPAAQIWAQLPVLCPWVKGNICKDPSIYGASFWFSSLCVAMIWGEKNCRWKGNLFPPWKRGKGKEQLVHGQSQQVLLSYR